MVICLLPATYGTVLEVEIHQPEIITMSITDAIGHIIATRNIRLEAGHNTIGLSEVSNLAPGHCVLQLIGS